MRRVRQRSERAAGDTTGVRSEAPVVKTPVKPTAKDTTNPGGRKHHGIHSWDEEGLCLYCRCNKSWPIAQKSCPRASIAKSEAAGRVRSRERLKRVR